MVPFGWPSTSDAEQMSAKRKLISGTHYTPKFAKFVFGHNFFHIFVRSFPRQQINIKFSFKHNNKQTNVN